LKGLFGPPAQAPRGIGAPGVRAASLGEQEARVIAEFSNHYKLKFNEPDLIKLALTHRSYLSVTGQGPRESNERLEFLGDSVLGVVTSEYLYRHHPNEHEGQLTKTKSLLVSKAILSRRGLAMGLGRFVLMSHSEIESGGRQRLSIVADAFEAVIGAIYLDLGFEAARDFIERWLLRDYREIAADKRHTNYKSHLQEYVQSTFRTHPVYRIRSEMGPDHSKQFMVEVMVGRRTLGAGRGRNKKEAEQAAARDALEKVQGRPADHDEPAEPVVDETQESFETRERHEEREPRPAREGRERHEEREPRPARAGREGREGREGRAGLSQAPAPAPEETTARPHVVEGVAADDEGAFGGARRRRGRRGGRGRRPPADEPARGVQTRAPSAAPEAEPSAPRPAEFPAHAPSKPTAPAGGSALRRARAARPGVVVEQRAPEVEPLPPAYEEDENEEIGRPEGPLDERHIDPYAVVEGPATDAGSDFERPSAGARGVKHGFVLPATPEREDEWPAGLEAEEEEPGIVEPESTFVEPESETEPMPEPGAGSASEADESSEWAPPAEVEDSPTPARDQPRFGRRPGRTRRGR
jgi:ribonuclease-3